MKRKRKYPNITYIAAIALLGLVGVHMANGETAPNAITGVTATGFHQGDNVTGQGSIDTAVDGTGLAIGLESDTNTWTHSNAWPDDWQGTFTNSAEEGWMVIDLGDVYSDLVDMFIWNVNEAGQTSRGTALCDIYYSTSPTFFPPAVSTTSTPYDFSSGGWTLLASSVAITQGDGSEANTIDGHVDLSSIPEAQYVGIDMLSNYGSAERVGLGEIQITTSAVPVAVTLIQSLFPADGDKIFETNFPVNVGASLLNGTETVDPASIELWVNGTNVVVGGDVSVSSPTTTVSHAIASLPAGNTSVSLVYATTQTPSVMYTNNWSFLVGLTPDPPATNALALWNVNMAGCVNNGLRTVTNGLVLVAPTTGGSNAWNNAYSPAAPWDSPNTTLIAANESNPDTVGIVFENSNWNDGPQSWAGFYTEFAALSNTIWGATQGDNDDGIVRFTGVDSNKTYDVYVYWTWNRNDDAKTFSVIEGTCKLPFLTMNPDRASVVANPTNYLEGTNYVVFTDVAPDASGNIAIQPNYSCAYQLVMRDGGGPVGPTIDPDILSFSVSGGMANLMWKSEAGINYNILSKSSLTDGWTTKKAGVASGGTSTTDSVSISGGSQEFFRIEGN